jgi:hypothetical protein
MPLLHDSLSHGPIAFGFYNIETDGLLLDRDFFFATDFCQAGLELAERDHAVMAGWRFDDPLAIGDLMGAIHGVRLAGYLGAVYRRWPFPEEESQFRQKLYGAENRAPAQAILEAHAPAAAIALNRAATGEIAVGAYRFTPDQFRALVRYVRRGGAPSWERHELGECPPWARALADRWLDNPY